VLDWVDPGLRCGFVACTATAHTLVVRFVDGDGDVIEEVVVPWSPSPGGVFTAAASSGVEPPLGAVH
jgi:hypothetical protein